jgi:hypothetical protein
MLDFLGPYKLDVLVTVLYVVFSLLFLWCYVKIRYLNEELEYHKELNDMITRGKQNDRK